VYRHGAQLRDRNICLKQVFALRMHTVPRYDQLRLKAKKKSNLFSGKSIMKLTASTETRKPKIIKITSQ